MSETTPYHAKYYAHSLMLKHPSHSLQKLTAVLGDARVDLNPHQVEAALFAFNSPLKKDAILADEVGLGKTVEIGLVIAQEWADDMNVGLEREIKELEFEIKVAKGNAKKTLSLEEKVSLQRQVKELESKRNTKRRGYFEAQDKIEQQKDALLTEIEERLKQEITEEILFTIRWELK